MAVHRVWRQLKTHTFGSDCGVLCMMIAFIHVLGQEIFTPLPALYVAIMNEVAGSSL